ncbi:MAG: tetratricopeptide repeat protein, partial [Oceanipulchritudo sp.]
AFLGKGRTLEAAANLEWVARQGGASGQSFLLLGDIYLNEGMSPLAVRAYEAALESSEPGADRLLTVVDNLFTRGATGQAQTFLETVREALEGSLPEDQELRALNLEAQLALAEGRRDEAAGLLRSIIERDPLNGAALISLGDYYRDTGKTEEAVLQYERATRIEEVEVRALHALARMHVARKDYQEALHFLSEAQAIEPRPYVADYIEQLERVVRSL